MNGSLWAVVAAIGGQASYAPLAIFVGYTFLVMLLAAWANRLLSQTDFVEEYFLGRRGLGVVTFTLTYGATAASAGTFAGFPALIYAHGWVLALWIASYMVVPICGMGLLGKRLNQVARKTQAVTLPDVLRGRFDSPLPAQIAILVLVFLLSIYLVPQFKLGAIILRQLLAESALLHQSAAWLEGGLRQPGWLPLADAEYLICLLLFGGSVIAYTTYGGFRAVVWTDVLQGVVMVLGVTILLGLALWRADGLRNVTLQLQEMTPPEVGTVTFERVGPREAGDAAAATVRIPADQWIWTGRQGEELLIRTNESAILLPGESASAPVKAVRITTPAEIERIVARWGADGAPQLPSGVEVGSLAVGAYSYGAHTPGVYTWAPGPSAGSPLGFLPMGMAFSFFVYWSLSGAGQPASLVRLMAFDSSRTLRRSIAALTIYFGMIYFPLVIIFCCARVIMPGLDQTPDRIMPALVVELSNWAGTPWLAGLLIAAPFAAAMSTVDSLMLLIASSLVRDVYQQRHGSETPERVLKRLSYAVMILVGGAAMLAAANPPQFLQYIIVFTGGGLSVTFLVPMVLALYWPRLNTPGMVAAMLGGLATYLGLYVVGFVLIGRSEPYTLFHLDPLIWGFAASLLAGVAVSRATVPLPNRLVNQYFAR